ncbi:hypothetical protein GOBAR_AA23105 [Gossypium barbadense]|uniref:Uncharacterized protein n=1 Tax=Gossypium barbadense TaxID=3634 RepID=A0A2P5X2K2_GOSBA|nr:hypothetical protein GOBAR_AA23105 [Gossypium barbadense]
MVRMREAQNHIVVARLVLVIITKKPYICITTPNEMERALTVRGIKLLYFAYEFFIPSRSHCVCEAMKDSFLLPLHILEAGFHLPLHSFLCNLLKTTASLLINYPVFPSGYPWCTFSIAVSVVKGIISKSVASLARTLGFKPSGLPLVKTCAPYKRSLTTDEAVAQFQRLDVGRVLALEAVLTARNVFMFCLENLNPNSWKLGMILTRRLEDPMNLLYHYCRMTLCPFALTEFEQKERAIRGTDLLIASTDPRVVDGTKGNRGCDYNFSETDNILRELNEDMDIDALIGSGHKKHKTSAEAVCTNSSNEEEESGAPLEQRQKKKVDHGGFVAKRSTRLSLFQRERRAYNCGGRVEKGHQEQVDNTIRKQDEAMTAFKQYTSQNILGSLQKFEENLLLHAQRSLVGLAIPYVDITRDPVPVRLTRALLASYLYEHLAS